MVDLKDLLIAFFLYPKKKERKIKMSNFLCMALSLQELEQLMMLVPNFFTKEKRGDCSAANKK